MIVVLEGIDACGKDTQLDALRDRACEATNLFSSVKQFRFPTHDTPSGVITRGLLTGTYSFTRTDENYQSSHNEKLARATLMQMCMTADRMPQQGVLGEHRFMPDSLLILSRYTLSGIVYGQADGLRRDWLVELNQHLVKPDLYLYLRISVEESVRRRPDRRDFYERDLDKLRKVKSLYDFETGAPDRSTIRVIDGEMSTAKVHEAVWHCVTEMRGEIALETSFDR